MRLGHRRIRIALDRDRDTLFPYTMHGLIFYSEVAVFNPTLYPKHDSRIRKAAVIDVFAEPYRNPVVVASVAGGFGEMFPVRALVHACLEPAWALAG